MSTLETQAYLDVKAFDENATMPADPLRRCLLFLRNRAEVASKQGFTAMANDLFAQRNAILELSALKADKARDSARLEGGELLSLIDGAKSVVEIWQPSTPAQIKWKEEWLKNARAQIDFAIRPTPPKATEGKE